MKAPVSRRRNIAVRRALLALAVGVSGPLAAQSTGADAARDLAASCTSCHGTGGVSAGTIASLAGQSKDDLVAKMQEFKTGKRGGTIMPQLAKGYTDEQIDLVAGWFAAQRSAK
jgi:sulfide dehydrogenase cytochrome subunit